MSEQDETYQKAWDPLTFRGLAKFATAKWPRLLLVEFVFTLILFSAVIWFVGKNYAPIIVKTIHQLPETGRLENGELKGIDSRLEAEGKFLSLAVDTQDLSDTGNGDLQVGFGRSNIVICSSVSSSWGCLVLDNPRESLNLSRSNVQPWWGARQPFIVMEVGLCAVIGALIILPLIAVVLMWIPKSVAYFADRALSSREAWKLSIAAQLPGVIVLTAAIFLYGLQAMDLLGVGVFYILHVLVGITYVIGAVFFLPPLAGFGGANPFKTSDKK